MRHIIAAQMMGLACAQLSQAEQYAEVYSVAKEAAESEIDDDLRKVLHEVAEDYRNVSLAIAKLSKKTKEAAMLVQEGHRHGR